MTSPLMEYLGIAGLDIAWLFIGIFVVLLILLVLIIVQFAKYKKREREESKGHPQYPEKTGILLSEGRTGKIRCL